MNRIEKTFNKKNNVFIGYLTGGDPSLDKTKDLVLSLEKGGADIIEIGIPYSDPLADGPTIQEAAKRALSSNFSLEKLFQVVEEIREESEVPLVFLVYYNTIYRYGIDRFANKCKTIGIDGLIVPDLPLEERGEFPQEIVPLIPLVSLNSNERIEDIVRDSTGFIYCISSFGVTGTRSEISKETVNLVKTVKKFTNTPVAVGFGISNKEMLGEVFAYADAGIVGSAIVDEIGKSKGCSISLENKVRSFLD